MGNKLQNFGRMPAAQAENWHDILGIMIGVSELGWSRKTDLRTNS
jgi:hypothetical protein